jgi:hypothetical protein
LERCYYYFCPRLKTKKNAQKSRRVFCFLSIYHKVNVKYVTSFESALSSLGPFSGIWVRYSGVSDPPSVVTRRGVDPRRAMRCGRRSRARASRAPSLRDARVLGNMARGLKRHLKRLNAPKHWMLDKLGGVFAPKPSPGACRAKGFARAGRWATRAPRERAMTRDRDRDRCERYLVDRH